MYISIYFGYSVFNKRKNLKREIKHRDLILIIRVLALIQNFLKVLVYQKALILKQLFDNRIPKNV